MANTTNMDNGRPSVDQLRQSIRDQQQSRKETGDHDPLKAVPTPGFKAK